VPSFIGMSEGEIQQWLQDSKVSNFEFKYVMNSTASIGTIESFEIIKSDERDETKVKDRFVFFVAKDELIIDPVLFEDTGKWRGVNLGGWFVLEGWMTPDLFSGVSGSDETIFMQQKENAEKEIINHWETFITEEDFIWLKEIGIDYVRLPIPWWLFGETAYVGTKHEVTYARSVDYIDQAMLWAEKHDIYVLLDLHTAPGGQNGFDNGGLTDTLDWGKNESETGYVAKTVEVLELITTRYNSYESFWGIEVLNEPRWDVDMNVLQNFYVASYESIREINKDVYIGFHDGFRANQVSIWKTFFETNDFHNVFMDIHLYSVFTDEIKEYDIYQHNNRIEIENGKLINNYDGIVPIVVGEWSLGLPNEAYDGYDSDSRFLITQSFNNVQMNTYNKGQGWFFWNYKVDRDSHLEWDFRRLYEDSYLPETFE
jgi:glucan 1,3-beta-glucosidase